MNIHESKKLSSRSGRFKKKLVTADKLKEEATSHLLKIPHFIIPLESGKMKDVEFVACYILLYLSSRYPHTWLGSYQPLETKPNHLLEEIKWDSLPFQFESNIQKRLKKYQTKSVLEIIECFNLKSTPEVVRLTLIKWASENYQLNLMFHVPSPMEVLRLQQYGRRCVTTLVDERMASFVLGERDALSFTLHDLIHAHHFFKNTEFLEGQVGFYRMLLSSFEDFPLDHSGFYQEFEYLMSDMNAYPIHLLKCLESAMSFYFDKNYFLNWTKKINAPYEFGLLNTSHYQEGLMDHVLLDWLKGFPEVENNPMV